ncbi:MAG TPA: hypothetical protein VHU87_00950 [Rhizomicrobium sp.]|jgi:trehalose-6-phosphatase|nr:hypothetical protein [Rhizomicrobium sp.]
MATQTDFDAARDALLLDIDGTLIDIAPTLADVRAWIAQLANGETGT